MPPEAETEAEAPVETPDITQTPPEVDPYFVKDGKAFTGQGEPVDVPEPAKEETSTETKPVDEKAKTEKKKQTAGEVWKEIRQTQKQQKAEAHAVSEFREQLERDRKTFDEERTMMRSNFRGWLKQQNLSLKDIIEEDLKEQDVDPVQKKFSELEAHNKKLEQMVEQLLNKDRITSEQSAQQQDFDALKTHAATVVEEYPLTAARVDKLAPRMRAAYYAHKEATGQKPTMDMLFSHFEQELVDLGVAAPNPPQLSAATKKPLSPARGKGTSKLVSHADEDQEPDNGVDSDGPASLTNRATSVRATNGRKRTREEHLANAAALLKFHS